MEEKSDVVFREAPQRTLKLDLYLPSTAGPSPFMIWVHGGFWTSGGRYHYPMFDRMVEQGVAVADVQYRLARVKQYPAAVRDVVAALKWLRANANEYGIDADRCALAGASAGAHLSALIATAPDHEHFHPPGFHPDIPVDVNAFVGYSGPYDLRQAVAKDHWAVKRFLGRDAPIDRHREGSPVTHVDAADPPGLLIHGTEDEIVPYRSMTVLADTYREAGAPVETVTVEGAGHMIIGNKKWRDQTLPAQKQFLTEHLELA